MQPNSYVGGYDLRIGKGQQLRMQVGSGRERAKWYDRSGDNASPIESYDKPQVTTKVNISSRSTLTSGENAGCSAKIGSAVMLMSVHWNVSEGADSV